ncbi:MAG TPA: cytochrome c peroxidase [Halothiobacillus sp.]|nr:cytochrome c peroxidase [Halothiobacillus sp.]
MQKSPRIAIGMVIGCTAAIGLSAYALAASPIPMQLWLIHPLDSLKLAQGDNPHPVKLITPVIAPLSAMAELGKTLFYDPSLSGSGKESCASCHDPHNAYGPPVGSGPVMLGGPTGHSAGFRAVPSLRYLYRQPPFTIAPDPTGDNDTVVTLSQQAAQAADSPRVPKSVNNTHTSAANLVPHGGLFWDGRVNTLQQQADGPLFNPVEMDAGTPARVATILELGPHATLLRQLFGQSVFDNPNHTVSEAMFAIARYQIEDPGFHPFSSKYDAWLVGKARFTPAELRGYLLFNDPNKGNCAACHLSQPTRDHLPPQFTDAQYEALGVPRNPNIPANGDPHFFDMGICGPFRTDMSKQTQYCGLFLTPSLRNAATRHAFFHNGVFHDLTQVMDWYVNRDLHPERFYPKDAAGTVIKYNDIPAEYRKNVDTFDAPFNRHPGDAPALTQAEQADIITFIKTLTDADAKNQPD